MDVDETDFAVSGSGLGDVALSVSGRSDVWDVQASGGNLADLNGTVALGFASGRNIRDRAGNALSTAGTPVPDDRTFLIDNAAPTVTVSGVPIRTTGAFTVTVAFSEPMTGFDASDVSVSGGTKGAFVETLADRTWTLAITPSADYSVSVGAGAAADLAGIGNEASDPVSGYYTDDNTGPTLASIVRSSPASEYTNGSVATWRVTFDEDVAGVDADDFSVSGGGDVAVAAARAGVGGSLSNRTYDVSISGGSLATTEGRVSLGLASGATIRDGVENALTDRSLPSDGANENSYVFDHKPPTVRITGLPSNPVQSFTATIAFSEQVSGFDVADVELTGGAAGRLVEATAGTVWTLPVTRTGREEIALKVPAGVAQDRAGNPNLESGQGLVGEIDPEERRVLKESVAGAVQATFASANATIGVRFDAPAAGPGSLTLAGETILLRRGRGGRRTSTGWGAPSETIVSRSRGTADPNRRTRSRTGGASTATRSSARAPSNFASAPAPAATGRRDACRSGAGGISAGSKAIRRDPGTRGRQRPAGSGWTRDCGTISCSGSRCPGACPSPNTNSTRAPARATWKPRSPRSGRICSSGTGLEAVCN